MGDIIPRLEPNHLPSLRVERDGKPMHLRLVTEGNVVVTALLTSKIGKYGG